MKHVLTLFAALMLVSFTSFANEPAVPEDALKGVEQSAAEAVDTGTKEAKKANKKAKKAWKKKAKELKAPMDETGTDSAPAPAAN